MRAHIAFAAIVSAGLAAAEAGEADSPKLVLESAGFTTAVNSIDLSPDGRWLAAAGAKVVRIWDLETGRLKSTLRGYDGLGVAGTCQAVAFAPGGREVVVGVVDDNPAGNIRVYQTSRPDETPEVLPGHPGPGVARLVFSRDGEYLASVDMDQRSVIIWHWATRRQLVRLTVPWRIAPYLDFPITGLPVLASIEPEGRPVFWSAIQGGIIPVQPMFDAEGRPLFWSAIHGRAVADLTPAEFGEMFGDAGKQRAFVELAPRIMKALPPLREVQFPYANRPTLLRMDLESGHVLAGGTGQEAGRDHHWIGLWSIAPGGGLVRFYEGHGYTPTAVALSRDREWVVSADSLGDIHVWAARTGKVRYSFIGAGQPIYKVGFDTSGRNLAFGTKSFGNDRWGFNSYGDLDQRFDFADHRLAEARTRGLSDRGDPAGAARPRARVPPAEGA